MPSESIVKCTCGDVTMKLTGAPIMAVECMCNSCRAAGAVLESLPGAASLLDDRSATLSAMYRKDRVECVSGETHLREYRLKPESKTRRVVAACCNSAMFLEFTSGHWVDIYGRCWPQTERPKAEMRTMVGDLPPGTILPNDIPNSKGHPFAFFARLIGAWAAMRFRAPAIDYVHGDLDLSEFQIQDRR